MNKSTENLLTFAKILVDSGGVNTCGITADIYHVELEKLARANKRGGESVHQAYARLGRETETGALLLKGALWGPKPRQAPQDLPLPKPNPTTEAGRELQELAEFMAKEKNISGERASGRILADPSRKDLLQRLMREEREATREVRDQRWSLPA